MPIATLFLSKKQVSAIGRGKGIQLTAAQMQAGGSGSGVSEVQIDLSPAVHKRWVSAQRRGKGVRIAGSAVQGGAINMSWLGEAANQVKRVIPKSAVKVVAKTGLRMAGVDSTAADMLVNNAVDSGYKTDWKKRGALKSFAKDTAMSTAQDAVGYVGDRIAQRRAQEAGFGGEGVKRKPRFAKGSAEAIAYMASIRRKGKGCASCSTGVPAMTGGAVGRVKRLAAVIESKTDSNGMLGGHYEPDVVSGNFLKREVVRGRGMHPLGSGMKPLGSN